MFRPFGACGTMECSYRNAARTIRDLDTPGSALMKQDGEQQQGTVVTAERGTLAGRRVIRGRERECREYYGV